MGSGQVFCGYSQFCGAGPGLACRQQQAALACLKHGSLQARSCISKQQHYSSGAQVCARVAGAADASQIALTRPLCTTASEMYTG